MSSESGLKHIGYMVQTKTGKGPWYDWLATQSPTEKLSISRFDYQTRSGGFKSEGKDARLVHTFIMEVQ